MSASPGRSRIRQRLALLMLVLAVPLAQWAWQLHSLSHAAYEIAALEAVGGAPPPLDHSGDSCLAYLAIGGTIAGAAPMAVPAADAVLVSRLHRATEVAAGPRLFDSRAPPGFS